MFLLSRSTFREDLRSAVVSRFIARPLRLSGPHHSRRGRPDSLFLHWAWYSGMVRSITQEPGNVARLVTCLSLSSSMLSGTPGCRLCARPLRARRMACARMEGIGTFPIFKVFGAMGQIQGIHPSPRLLLFVLPLAFAFSRYTTERLTRPYSGGPTRLRGFPLDRQPLPGYLRVGRSLPELQDDVCVLCWPPAFAAVPQYLVHTPVELLPLIEPDKRISHTYGSSVSYSASLRSTTRVQVYADSRLGPSDLAKRLDETGPRVCPPLGSCG